MRNFEEFSESQIKTLERYVTNTSSNIFVLRNLPEVIKGAIFSRYSRSSLGLRSLLLKEFILNEEISFSAIAGKGTSAEVEEQTVAIKKAQSFYDRILDGYGDDSIGELGGAHLALENISMIGAKIIEDARIGGSPLEKSTRYIYFDQKIDGEYLFFQEPILMTSAYRDLYMETCNALFDTYSKLIPPLTALIEQQFPKGEVSPAAYTASLRAKVLDCLRGLLPASALTNMGVFGNGRFFEKVLQKLHSHNLAEMQDIGKKSFQELSKVVPSFIRRSDPSHKHQQAYVQFMEEMQKELKQLAQNMEKEEPSSMKGPSVKLVHHDPDACIKVAAALLFEHSQLSLPELEKICKTLPEEEILRILDAACTSRENRRHKSPRALENAPFTFEILADFGAYRDLQRHRMLTQERQMLSCHYGYFIPSEILGTEMEKPYIEAMERGKKAYDTIAKELPEEAQYVVPMAYHIRWYYHVNLRGLQWLCELRSSPAGHPNYRLVAQEMAKQVCAVEPRFERFFKFVDFGGYGLGRLGSEVRSAEKLQNKV